MMFKSSAHSLLAKLRHSTVGLINEASPCDNQCKSSTVWPIIDKNDNKYDCVAITAILYTLVLWFLKATFINLLRKNFEAVPTNETLVEAKVMSSLYGVYGPCFTT